MATRFFLLVLLFLVPNFTIAAPPWLQKCPRLLSRAQRTENKQKKTLNIEQLQEKKAQFLSELEQKGLAHFKDFAPKNVTETLALIEAVSQHQGNDIFNLEARWADLAKKEKKNLVKDLLKIDFTKGLRRTTLNAALTDLYLHTHLDPFSYRQLWRLIKDPNNEAVQQTIQEYIQQRISFSFTKNSLVDAFSELGLARQPDKLDKLLGFFANQRTFLELLMTISFNAPTITEYYFPIYLPNISPIDYKISQQTMDIFVKQGSDAATQHLIESHPTLTKYATGYTFFAREHFRLVIVFLIGIGIKEGYDTFANHSFESEELELDQGELGDNLPLSEQEIATYLFEQIGESPPADPHSRPALSASNTKKIIKEIDQLKAGCSPKLLI